MHATQDVLGHLYGIGARSGFWIAALVGLGSHRPNRRLQLVGGLSQWLDLVFDPAKRTGVAKIKKLVDGRRLELATSSLRIMSAGQEQMRLIEHKLYCHNGLSGISADACCNQLHRFCGT
jgi:hypothetical protein